MRTLSVVLLATMGVVAVSAKTLWHQLDDYTYEQYLSEHNKAHPAHEVESRRANFAHTLRQVRAHNADASKSWKEGMNHMSDWHASEYEDLLGYNKAVGYQRRAVHNTMHASALAEHTAAAAGLLKSLPDAVDWRTASPSVVSPVKDQGQCGSCWTFATAATVESHWAIKTGSLMELSEQQIASCSPNPLHCGGSGGCEGGTAEIGFNGIFQVGGLASEWTYPYVSWTGKDAACAFNRSTTFPVAFVSGYVQLPSNQYAPLMAAVANEGPIAISADASSWRNYESGVFDGCNQTSPDIDHAIQLVGYGTDATLGAYWLVRNSWTTVFGEEGYIRLKRTEMTDLRCGVDRNPADGSGCTGGPTTQEVCGTCGVLFDNAYPVVYAPAKL